MLIASLYEALDELEGDARSTAEDFAETGDLLALKGRLDKIGDRAYALFRGVDKVIAALKFED